MTDSHVFASAADRAVQLEISVHVFVVVVDAVDAANASNNKLVVLFFLVSLFCRVKPQEIYANPNILISKIVVTLFIFLNYISFPHKFMLLNFITSKKI